jgi:hypothetical protein
MRTARHLTAARSRFPRALQVAHGGSAGPAAPCARCSASPRGCVRAVSYSVSPSYSCRQRASRHPYLQTPVPTLRIRIPFESTRDRKPAILAHCAIMPGTTPLRRARLAGTAGHGGHRRGDRHGDHAWPPLEGEPAPGRRHRQRHLFVLLFGPLLLVVTPLVVLVGWGVKLSRFGGSCEELVKEERHPCGMGGLFHPVMEVLHAHSALGAKS